jgi:hypothetical protein
MFSRVVSSAFILGAFIFSAGVSADVPGDVRDLVGKKARNADPRLQQRGYVHINSQKTGGHNSYGMWWQPSSRTCLNVGYEHGRVESIRTAPPVDCNQHDYYSSSGDDDDSSGAALAIGAVALLGVLAMSHDSEHHEDQAHYDDRYNEEEFERGHRDGLYNHSFSNYNNTDAYGQGYRSGADQREHNSSYRYQTNHYDNGYRQKVDFSDLQGARASSADSELQNRGFVNVDGAKSDSASYTYWYNGYTGQCLQMMTVNGRAEDIRDIGHHPQCR